MVDGIPLDLQVKAITPSTEKVFYFKDKNHGENAPKHYYICLPTINNTYICLVMSSSQTKKTEKHYKEHSHSDYYFKRCEKSLVKLSVESRISFINKNSIIDCNRPKYGTLEQIKNDINGNLQICTTNIPIKIYNELINAVMNSPRVKPHIKNNIKR